MRSLLLSLLLFFFFYFSDSTFRVDSLAMEEQHHRQPKPNSINASESDPFLLNYTPSDLRTASEFLATWLPFLSRDLCTRCTQSLSDRIQSIDPGRNPLTFLQNSRFFPSGFHPFFLTPSGFFSFR